MTHHIDAAASEDAARPPSFEIGSIEHHLRRLEFLAQIRDAVDITERIGMLRTALAASDDGPARPPQEPSVPVQARHIAEMREQTASASREERITALAYDIERLVLEALRSASLRETADPSASVSQRAREERNDR